MESWRLEGRCYTLVRRRLHPRESFNNMDAGGESNRETRWGLSNFFEMLLILAIPASLTYTYGRMVGSRRQGWAIFSAMAVLLVIGVAVIVTAEQHGTPAQHLAGVTTHHFAGSTGGNLEGKEQRFGIANTSLWSAITTVTSTGAVNGSLESLTGIGGVVPFADLGMRAQLGGLLADPLPAGSPATLGLFDRAGEPNPIFFCFEAFERFQASFAAHQ